MFLWLFHYRLGFWFYEFWESANSKILWPHLWVIHERRRHIYSNFWYTLPPCFYFLPLANFMEILTPWPLQIAKVFYGRPLSWLFLFYVFCESKVALWCHYVQKCVSYAMIYFYTLVLFLGRIFRSQARVGETANCGKEEYLKLQISKYEHQQDIAKACTYFLSVL